jgi:hypothetical protein
MFNVLKMFKIFNKQSVRFKAVYYCTSLNATRHHRCGNETRSDGLVLANNKPWIFVSLGSGLLCFNSHMLL